MVTISQIKQYSELAQASYADLPSGILGNVESYTNPLKGEKFTNDQSVIFATRYRVLATSQEYGLGGLSGFDAVLFEDTQNDNKKIFAIRGTDQLIGADWDDDLSQGLVAGDTPLQFEDMVAFFEQLKSEGKITAGEKITVTGHSLGGALTQAFTAAYRDHVSYSYTYVIDRPKRATHDRANRAT